MHAVSQRASQQTPSVQKPLLHCESIVQFAPSIPDEPPLPLLDELLELPDVLPDILPDELTIALELLEEAEPSIPPVPPVEPEEDWDPT